jgi:hypothetical protein
MYEGGTVALDNAAPVAGTGITFPATQSASSNANTLDDYEEGTWSLTPNSGSVTGSAAYVKIGKLVTLTFDFTVNSGGGSTMTIPFPAVYTLGVGIYTSGQDYNAGTTSPTAVVGGSSSTMYFRTVGDNVAFAGMGFTTGAQISGVVSYVASA